MSFTPNRTAWIDAKRTQAEMKPAKNMRRIADYLEAIEAGRQGGPKKVEKKPKLLTVEVDGAPMGFSRLGEWSWTDAARAIYSAEQMDMAATFAAQQ